LDAALDALRYLHGHGLVHGALDPQHVVAVGNTIKLAPDALRESEDLEGDAEDVRQLGTLIGSLLPPNEMGEPLRTIVEHTTEPDPRNRWTLAEITMALHPAPPIAPAPPPAVMLPPPIRRPAVKPASPLGFPKWIFAGLAGVLLLILGLNLRRGGDFDDSGHHHGRAPIAPPPAKPAPAPGHALSQATWRVIAFTYGSQDAASKKAQLNNAGRIYAAVFSPKERSGYYLVALRSYEAGRCAAGSEAGARGRVASGYLCAELRRLRLHRAMLYNGVEKASQIAFGDFGQAGGYVE
jgi:hypothetical protein